MDPNATWQIIGSGADLRERAAAALDLLLWLSIGGMLPVGISNTMARNTCRIVIGNALDRLDELTED